MGNARILAFYITICCVAFIISKIIISVLLYLRWCKKRLVFQDNISGGKMVIFRLSIKRSLTSEAFLKKTMKLSTKDIIGSGGYGTVYKLIINDNISFAVKKLNRDCVERDRGFERELESMSDIKKRNIVPLHGYYTAPQFNLLIYELMPNESLDVLLHGNSFVTDLPSNKSSNSAIVAEGSLDASAKADISLGAETGTSEETVISLELLARDVGGITRAEQEHNKADPQVVPDPDRGLDPIKPVNPRSGSVSKSFAVA